MSNREARSHKMKSRTARVRLVVGLLLAVVLMPSLAQQNYDLAGRVISVSGEAVAVGLNGASRQLTRRMEFYVGDSIKTGDQGSIQIRMIDSALISLSCNSELKIESYSYEANERDLVVLRLVSGRLRSITGDIGQQRRDGYQFFVGDSQVKIRGTDFEVSVAANGDVYFANYDGGITVENAQGKVNLGVGADADFAVVEPGQAPRQLLFQPSQLGANSTPITNCL